MNPIWEAVQEAIESSLEHDTGIWLPDQFTLEIVDDAFQLLLKGLVHTATQKPLEPTLKRVTVQMYDKKITIRSDRDPEPWLPVLRSETLH